MSATGRLLFVDDDALVLRGLERALRVHRIGFDCTFLDDPVVALGRLDDLRPDAVISDMLMPGLDGAAFLAEAARRRPTMARFVLSGEVGAGSLVRMAAAAHQCLAKPCRAEVLADVIRRAVGHPSASPASAVREGLYGLSSLPVPLAQLERLGRALDRPGSDPQDVEALAVIDAAPAVATKLVQVASWACLGVEAPPADVHDAYYRLGADAIRAMLEANLLGAVASSEETVFQRQTWVRAARMAAVARAIAVDEGVEPDAVRLAVLAASWRGAAPLVLDVVCRDEFVAIREAAPVGGQARAALERRAFGVSALEALAMLLRLWGLPAVLVSLVGEPDDSPELPGDSAAAVALAHAAEAVVGLQCGEEIPASARVYLDRTRRPDRLDQWRAAADQVVV